MVTSPQCHFLNLLNAFLPYYISTNISQSFHTTTHITCTLFFKTPLPHFNPTCVRKKVNILYTVYPHDVTPHTSHTLIRILKQNGYETMWLENLFNTKGFSDTYITQRCVDKINELNITLPDNIYGVTCNPIFDNEMDNINS